MFKNYIQNKLEKYVTKYFVSHPDVKLIVVAGSVGKTSTKTAIATVLSQSFRVRMENTNHNTQMSAPLAMLGIDYPTNIRNVFAWLRVFRAAKKRIKDPADVDVIVQELGTDRVGEIPHFGSYLRPYIGVVSAVTPEHMEFFGTIEVVAQEELAVANFSQIALINRDDIDGRFANFITNAALDTYGTSNVAEYRFEIENFSLEYGYTGNIIAPEISPTPASVKVAGEHSLRPVMAAVAVGVKMGMTSEGLVAGLANIHAVPGRMNVLKGLKDSTLIDDTYNSSPAAAVAALQTLYSLEAPQRIAILGSMNELGSSSAVEHQQLGDMCNPDLLSWVITVGSDAETYLAPQARAKGCQVRSFRSALDAGAFANSVLEENAVVLAKGSEGKVYLEEAIKMMLHETHEDKELVRQSPAWRKIKDDYFASA